MPRGGMTSANDRPSMPQATGLPTSATPWSVVRARPQGFDEFKRVQKRQRAFPIAVAAVWRLVRCARIEPPLAETRPNVIYIDNAVARRVHSLRQKKHATQLIKQAMQCHVEIETQTCDKNTCSWPVREKVPFGKRPRRSARAALLPRSEAPGSVRLAERSRSHSAVARRRPSRDAGDKRGRGRRAKGGLQHPPMPAGIPRAARTTRSPTRRRPRLGAALREAARIERERRMPVMRPFSPRGTPRAR